MGLLGDIYSASDTFKRRLKGLLSDPVGYVRLLDAQARDYNRNVEPVISGGLLQERPLSEKQLQDKYTNLAMLAPLGMIVWHGSPHKFSKFDMSKIGTGEGNQAYGHGIYTAESPAVAKQYQEGLSKTRPYVDGKPFEEGIASLKISEKAKDVLRYDLFNADRGRILRFADQGVPEYVEAASVLSKVKDPPSSLYKIDIPDEAVSRMLDWDKPLSQQSKEVQRILNPHIGKVVSFDPINETTFRMNFNGKPIGGYWGNKDKATQEAMKYITGKQFYEAAGKIDNISYPASADFLRAQGIPGIRYLDRGSRGTGTGTSNFVLFDDQLPRILEINGQATGNVPWKPGEWDGLLGP
jgi:hypothetical protein